MLGKSALIVLIALFGALMLAAGALAPESMRGRVAALAEKILPRKDSATNAAAPAAAAAAKDEPLRAEALIVPTPSPANGRYALQLGQFAAADEAEALAKRAKESGLSATAVLAVLDGAGQSWSVVAAGVYGSPEDARAARRAIAPPLGLAGTLPVILLPPPKPKPEVK